MQQLIMIIHVLVSLSLIGLVLLQHGKGADIGAAFGSGASQTLFGARGSGSFLVKVTSGLAAVFFTTCLLLGVLASQQAKQAPEGPVSSVTMPAAPVSGSPLTKPSK